MWTMNAIQLFGAILIGRRLGLMGLLCGAASAIAAYDGPMRFSTFWPCDGNSSVCATRVLAEGVIEPNSASKLELFLALKRPRGDELPPAPAIAFDSPGGSLSGGVLLGRLIRARKMDTALAPTYERVNKQRPDGYETFLSGARCASACALAFAGGVRRTAEDGSRMGVHQFSGSDRDIGDAATQVTVVQLASYLEGMGVKRELLDIASLVPASSIYWLKPEQLKRTRLDNTAPPVSAWELSATAQGVPLLTVRQEISTGKVVRVGLVRTVDRILIAVSSEFDKRFFREERLSGFPQGDPTCITLLIGKRRTPVAGGRRWERADAPRVASFACDGTISLAEAQALAGATSISIDDGFSNAIRDLSVSTPLGTENLASGLALLLRTR
jgi:hypothetical protein